MSNKKQLILDTTLRLITENGIQGSPVSLIAKEAQVAIGTIYHYFPAKQDILNELFCNLCKEIGEVLKSGDNPQLNIKERFFHFYQRFFQFFIDHPKAFFFIEQYGNPPFIPEEIVIDTKKYYQEAIDFLQEGMDTGLFKDMKIELMINFVLGCIL
ncbi:MAG: TetR/AcrR family transcriptional regulator, partial [Spirochaetes bacterium]|nr:TetR/AcrR family transcriptional regulator [Spirochaetota bacterium]